ncbi:MAG TPA: methyltransferase [Methanosarcinales archaeon]|nr:methyltransferase [Methanosarcinales archaeon]
MKKDLLNQIKSKAKKNHARVGIGIRGVNEKILFDIDSASEFADIVLIGDEKKIQEYGLNLEIIDTTNPEHTLVDVFMENKIDAAVRGSIKASATLSYLKKSLSLEKIHRLSLLQTPNNELFFFAPVGIDEVKTLSDKIEFIIKGVQFIRRFGIEPRVGVLSGGRFDDIGRDEIVDRTLADADFVANRVCELGISAKHYAILIESAVKEADFIFAPDGISGNLIFRTLVFLGAGRGFGAPIINIREIDKVFVDTSRVKPDYSKAIMMASATI